MHHIITDGTAMGLLVKDFVNYYNGQYLPDIKYNYQDYVVWQNTMREQGRFEAQKTFLARILGRQKYYSGIAD